MARRPVVRAALAALAVAALLGVAAAGAGSGTGFDGRGDRTTVNPDWPVLADYAVLSLVLLLVAAEVALVIVAVREHPEMLVRRPKRRSRAGVIAVVLALVLLVRFQDDFSRWYRERFGDHGQQPVPPAATAPPRRGDDRGALHPADGLGLVLTVLAGAALVGVVGGAGYVSWRRRRAAVQVGLREALAAGLDAGLEEIEQIEDPRLAVLACYDRLGRVLADHGLVPSPADTPGELVSRVLRAHDVAAPSADRLARLFERARFSDHPVNEAMRQEAIARLADVRDQLAASGAEAEAVPA